MKNFVIKLLTFSFILVLYFGLNALINFNIFHRSKLPIDDAKVLISGDSHPRRSLNPNRFDSAVNISQGSEPYVLTYWKLKYIFQNHKPDIMLLGFAHHNISAFNDMKFWNKYWSSEMFKRSYISGSFGSLDKINIDYPDYYKIFFRQMCLYPHANHFSFIGGYKNDNKSDLSDIEKAILLTRRLNIRLYRISNLWMFEVLHNAIGHLLKFSQVRQCFTF